MLPPVSAAALCAAVVHCATAPAALQAAGGAAAGGGADARRAGGCSSGARGSASRGGGSTRLACCFLQLAGRSQAGKRIACLLPHPFIAAAVEPLQLAVTICFNGVSPQAWAAV